MRILLMMAVVLGMASACPAVVTVLAGGDAGEGFAPLPTVFAAVDLYPNGGQPVQTVQGVAFNTNASAVVNSDTTGSPTGALNLGASANDVALGTVFGNNYWDAGTITLTISGLTAGTTYQFDFFAASTGGWNSMHVEYTTSTGVVLATEPGVRLWPAYSAQDPSLYPGIAPAYDIRTSIVAPANGIVLAKSVPTNLGGIGGSGGFSANARANALAVTYFVPEPATLALLGLSGLALLHRRRR